MFTPTYVDFGLMTPYESSIRFYQPATEGVQYRRQVSEFFASGRAADDGSAAGGTFIFRAPSGARRAAAQRNAPFDDRFNEYNALTLLEAFDCGDVNPCPHDASYYINHHIASISMYISATHNVKAFMPHTLPLTARGMTENVNLMEAKPIAALQRAVDNHTGVEPLLFERQEVCRPPLCLPCVLRFYPVRLASIPCAWLLSRAPGFYPAHLASIPRVWLQSRAPCFYPVRLASIPCALLLSRAPCFYPAPI